MVQHSTELPSLERDGYKAQSVGSGKELGNESIEPDVIGSYVFIPRNLTFAEVISILSKAIEKNSFEELDNVIQSIEYYEGRPVTLNKEDLKNFCLNQLNLDLNSYRRYLKNILSPCNFDKLPRNFDELKLKYNYPVKELVLLAVAANDTLMKKYQNIFFARENLSLLYLIFGGQKYIEAFINKFHELYQDLENQTRQLNTASLIKNEKFIKIVLGAFEKRYINEPTKDVKDLLKKSLVTLLETAINQEHASIVEYLCQKCTGRDKSVTDVICKGIYKEVFADERIIEKVSKQILKNIHSADKEHKGKKQKIYNAILVAALGSGNIKCIKRILNEVKLQSSNNRDTQNFLQESIDYILKMNIRERDISILVIEYLDLALTTLGDINSRKLVVYVMDCIKHVKRKYFGPCISSILNHEIEQGVDNTVIELLCNTAKHEAPHIKEIYKQEFKKALLRIEEQLNIGKNKDFLVVVKNMLKRCIGEDIVKRSIDEERHKGLFNFFQDVKNRVSMRKLQTSEATLKQEVDEKSSNSSSQKNPKPKNTDNRQPQKNVVDNRDASKEQCISNNYKVDEMHDSSQDTNSNDKKGVEHKNSFIKQEVSSDIKKDLEQAAQDQQAKTSNLSQDQVDNDQKFVEEANQATQLPNIPGNTGTQSVEEEEKKINEQHNQTQELKKELISKKETIEDDLLEQLKAELQKQLQDLPSAVKRGDLELVKYLIEERDISPNQTDNCGRNALHLAANRGNVGSRAGAPPLGFGGYSVVFTVGLNPNSHVHVSSSRLVKRSMRFSRTTLSW